MDKKQRKEFRSLLYQRYGSQYMEDKDSVETLYDAPFNWVMLEVKAGWHPTFILTEWKKRFNAMQRMIVEVCGNTLSLLKWDYYVSSLAACTHPETAKQVLLTGIGIDEAIEICQQKLSPDLLSALLQTISPGKIKTEDLLGFGIPQFGKSTSSRVLFEQQQGRAVRGEPVSVTLWKEERERVLDLRKKAVAKNPQLEYELLRLNWLIGDNQPKGGRVVRLKILSLATYHTLAEILELRDKVRDSIEANSSVIKLMALNSGDPRIWIDALQEWRNPYDVMQEIERVIKHCGEKTLDYADFHTNALNRIAYGLGVPAHLLMEDIPPVPEFIKARLRRDFGPHAVMATSSPLDEIYKAFVETPKVKSYPGGTLVYGSANAPGKLRSLNHNLLMYDCNEQGGPVDDWKATFTNTALGEQYIDWKAEAEKSRNLVSMSLDEVKERYGPKGRPTIAGAFAVKNHFSKEFSKQTTNMNNQQSTTNGQPMIKEEKRKRISEIENQLAQIKAHRKQVTDSEHCASQERRTLAIKIGATTGNGSSFYDQGVMLWPCEFMSTKTFMKLYKLELDETEAELTTELNKLIA